MKRVLMLAALAVAAICSAQHTPPGHAVKVMTQNLYLGADLTPLVAAGTFEELVTAVASRYDLVESTDFPARAELIADEIAREQPDLIGLQECVTWYRSAFDPSHPATDVTYDYLQTLMAALAARHQRYQVIAVEKGMDVEAPGLFPSGLRDVRLVDRDVILARSDRGMSFRNAMGVDFDNLLAVSVLGQPLPIKRGYCRVDVTYRGREFRLISAHLETFHPLYNILQGQEILDGPADTDMDVIYVGDFNSPADGSQPYQAYQQARAAGFDDAWSYLYPDDLGNTWGHAEDLLDPPNFTQRIDFALFRGSRIIPTRVSLFGLDTNVVTGDGLYPSDHAGLVATFVVK